MVEEINFIKIQNKWQQKWKEFKIFEAEVKDQKKFFLNFPYPYINAYSHVGHLYTLARVDAFARFKRHKGFNVLFPQGWHATGSPIVNAAKRVKDREEKQIKIMEDMGISSEEELTKFEKPEYWIKFFAPEFKKDYSMMGMSIDWRREFHTTSLNPYYDKFIRWQFNKLKKRNYIIKGKFPVVWCPSCNNAVGDHSRSKGEGETTQEFLLFKFKLEDGRNIITATLRPDTILGITNVYVNPNENYLEIETNKENWIVSETIIEKLKNQDYNIKIGKKVKGIDLIGKEVECFGDRKIPVLPATFLDINYGTGMVHSVPSDSADDLIALKDLQKDDETINKYNLDKKKIKAIEPIEIFNTPGVGGNSAQFFLDKYDVKNQNERDKLDKIKKELYKLTFATSTLNSKYKKGFSKNLEGMGIEEAQKIIKKELLEQNKINVFYELTGKVVCRCLTQSIVKIVDNQWFLNYADENWKEKTHECLDNLKIYPEKARQQFNYVIDWLHEWACTREEGLGTKLPWDEHWLIESLSDSTIYMAFYTIVHKLKNIPLDKVNDELFDYIFSGEETKLKIEKNIANDLRNTFKYWYPVDFRNSGKDLIQNHLTFYMFNHTAIFEKENWPKGIAVNGWVTVNGQKMSKSLGNMIPMRKMAKTFSADVSRATILSGGESLDDPNWDSNFAKSLKLKLNQWIINIKEQYNKGKEGKEEIDIWMESKLNKLIKISEEAMEETNFRTALQNIFFELNRNIKWYMKRNNNNPNKKIMNKIIESQIVMMTPFIPHLCEEAWQIIGKEKFVSLAEWPKYDESKIKEDNEEIVKDLINDINQVLKLAKLQNVSKIQLFVSKSWKYNLYELLKGKLEETRNPKNIIPYIMQTELKQHGQDIMKLIPKIIKTGSLPKFTSKEKEIELLENLKEFLKSEFNSEINIIDADNSKETKAKNAMPGKPAILVE